MFTTPETGCSRESAVRATQAILERMQLPEQHPGELLPGNMIEAFEQQAMTTLGCTVTIHAERIGEGRFADVTRGHLINCMHVAMQRECGILTNGTVSFQ